MKSFERFLSLLATIPDPRRAEGKLYKLPHVLLFSILAVVTGANSYRGIRTFIAVHRRSLNKAFKIDWRKAFRDHAAKLNDDETISGVRALAFDGKVLKGSFDAFNDVRAKQILSAFATDTALVLAHIEIDEKSNEIPAAQKLLEELGVADRIVTL